MSLDRILSDLDRHKAIFDLERHRLGERALDVAIGGVEATFTREESPEGGRWPELSSDYGRWKRAHFPGRPMGVLDDVMRPEIDGERVIEPDRATVTCGRSEEARDHAAWFQGHGRGPERRFFGLTPEAVERSTQLFDEHFKEQV